MWWLIGIGAWFVVAAVISLITGKGIHRADQEEGLAPPSDRQVQMWLEDNSREATVSGS